MNSDYLIHYGVLGMKWGVRKQRENYLIGRKAKYLNDKAEYKRLKGARASQSKVAKAKANMKSSKRLMKIQKRVGKHNKINERYSQKGGRLIGAVDTILTGSGRSVNKSLNKGNSELKAYLTTAAKSIAISSASSVALGTAGSFLLHKKLGLRF